MLGLDPAIKHPGPLDKAGEIGTLPRHPVIPIMKSHSSASIAPSRVLYRGRRIKNTALEKLKGNLRELKIITFAASYFTRLKSEKDNKVHPCLARRGMSAALQGLLGHAMQGGQPQHKRTCFKAAHPILPQNIYM